MSRSLSFSFSSETCLVISRVCVESREAAQTSLASFNVCVNLTTALPRIKPFSLRSSRFAFTPEGRKRRKGGNVSSSQCEKIPSSRDHLERVQSRKSPRDGPTRLRPLLTAVAITKGWLRQEFVRSLNALCRTFQQFRLRHAVLTLFAMQQFVFRGTMTYAWRIYIAI